MGMGGSIFLLAVGAILAFAVDWHVSGVDLDVVGWILMAVGVIGLLVFVSIFRRRRAAPPPPPPPPRATVVEQDPRYYDY